MRIDHLTISNFKNFSSATIDMDKGVNLFVGGNGSGKTAILKAVNVAAGGFFASQEQKLQRMIEFDEIKIDNGIRLASSSISATSRLFPKKWTRTINRDTKNNDTKNIKPASEYGKSFFKKFEDREDRTVAPVIAYYSTQRLFKDASKSEKQRYDPLNGRRNGYLQCLTENAIKEALNEWLGNAVTKRATLQIKEIAGDDNILPNVEGAIRKTLINFLELPADFSLKIYQDPEFDNQLFVNFDNEHNLPITYYSDGFRNILYLIIDIFWRASQLNPWLTLEELCNLAYGVITIDEIDLHLHPKWQSKAIPLLQSLLPNVQFFITTHSPIVVSTFEGGSLYTIQDNAIEKAEDEYFGKQVNNVLRNILGAYDRHRPTQEKLDRLFRLIDEGKAQEYEPLLKELFQLLGNEDPDITKAETLIEWAKISAVK